MSAFLIVKRPFLSSNFFQSIFELFATDFGAKLRLMRRSIQVDDRHAILGEFV